MSPGVCRVGITSPDLGDPIKPETPRNGDERTNKGAELRSQLAAVKQELKAMSEHRDSENGHDEFNEEGGGDDIVTTSKDDGLPPFIFEEDAAGDPYKMLLQQQAKTLHQVACLLPPSCTLSPRRKFFFSFGQGVSVSLK